MQGCSREPRAPTEVTLATPLLRLTPLATVLLSLLAGSLPRASLCWLVWLLPRPPGQAWSWPVLSSGSGGSLKPRLACVCIKWAAAPCPGILPGARSQAGSGRCGAHGRAVLRTPQPDATQKDPVSQLSATAVRCLARAGVRLRVFPLNHSHPPLSFSRQAPLLHAL